MLELGQRLGDLNGKLVVLQGSVEAVNRDLDEARSQLVVLDALQVELANARQMLRHVYEEDPAQRGRLYALRESEEYELAFSETEPLVSFVIPTYDRFESLRDVSIPSILGQTYANLEVIVAGDCAPAETEQVIAEFDDPRIRFHNRSVRGPYPDDETVRWYMIGTPPFNDGLALAKGRWIAALGDDDAVRPNHTETLLHAAQERRYEHCYGRYQVHYPNGEVLELGSFPPKKGEYVLQASLYHAGLRFLQLEPSDYLYAEPNDWSLCRRMLSAGVRFGMVEGLVADKYESRYQSHADWSVYGLPSVE
jgi:Glycosyl transferase family 2